MSVVTENKLKLIALAGIPNVGKTTIFNQLTELNQKIGNYPGVTVDKKSGTVRLDADHKLQLVDLPGTYSLFPRSEDEVVVYRVLCGLEADTKPDAVLAIADMSNLERSLFFITQIIDLGIPVALVLNMEDAAQQKGLSINTFKLFKELGVPVITVSARHKKGVETIQETLRQGTFNLAPAFLPVSDIIAPAIIEEVKEAFGFDNDYQALHILKFANERQLISEEEAEKLERIIAKHSLDMKKAQTEETTLRYKKIQELLSRCVSKKEVVRSDLSRKLDKFLLHPVGGYALFIGILLVIFQAVFAWASLPMDMIDMFFGKLSAWTSESLPEGALTSLLSEGIIPGIGGIVIFIPQIALLFGFLTILEDSGYMSRAVFLTDRLMRPFGLNGKSVVPLISGMACAIPAIMAARNIGNSKDRLITILVAPLMSCSARLPVYVILIGLVVPNEKTLGFFNMQGLALMGMYLLGIAAALLSAWVMKLFIKIKDASYLVVELPSYQWPRWKNVAITMFEKSKTFVFEAGKVILAISVVLWVLASYGPSDNMEQAVASVPMPEVQTEEAMQQYENKVASKKLEASYAGIVGKTIEPVIRPLGYDWKIGIALVTSFAAREVFVSTIATLYSIGEDTENETTIRQRLKAEIRPDTNQPVYNQATGWSLLIFYAFAMQCMSTLAVVYRETKGWKWPLIQTFYMSGLAYVSAFIVYNVLS
jgi:ferrous iron transport protein B